MCYLLLSCVFRDFFFIEIREVKEECGLLIGIADMTKMGIIDFEFTGNPEILEVHIFSSDKYDGSLSETEG